MINKPPFSAHIDMYMTFNQFIYDDKPVIPQLKLRLILIPPEAEESSHKNSISICNP